MKTVKIKTGDKTIEVCETQFLEAIIGYMAQTSPNNVKIVATETKGKKDGKLIIIPVKNQSELRYYTDIIPEPESNR